MDEIIQIIEFFSVSGVVIADARDEIVWADGRARRAAGLAAEPRTFDALFPGLSTRSILAAPRIFIGRSGEKYQLKGVRVALAGTMYTIVSVDDMSGIDDGAPRLFCLERIVEALDDGIVMSDRQGRIVLYNKAQESMEGLAAQEVVGKYLWDAYQYQVDKSEHRKVYNTRAPIIDSYCAHSYQDGIPRYVSYSTYPIQKDGEVIAVYSVSKNETRLQDKMANILQAKRERLRETVREHPEYAQGTHYSFLDVKGVSEQMNAVVKEAQNVAALDCSVLIIGETGTGKEVFAQSIHNFSKKRTEPFIAVNCAAIPDTLLESILFGTVRGAFTGAVNQAGLFEEARTGTLYLDEINSMPVNLQSKLLRALQEKSVRRVGGAQMTPVFCRVICSTNEEPQKLIAQNRLRQDLFYRIGHVCLYVPPLRERRADIMDLVDAFVKRFNRALGKQVRTVSAELEAVLLAYQWPGNVRELEHVVENLMIRTENVCPELQLGAMPPYLKKMIVRPETRQASVLRRYGSLAQTMFAVEKEIVEDCLDRNNWNLAKTAQELGVIRQSVQYRIKKLGIRKKRSAAERE